MSSRLSFRSSLIGSNTRHIWRNLLQFGKELLQKILLQFLAPPAVHILPVATRTPVSMVKIGKLSRTGYLRRDDTIHQKGAMSFLSNVWPCRIDEGTTAHFGRSSNQAEQDILDAFSEPALRISEDVGIACARRKVVYDDVGIGEYWA